MKKTIIIYKKLKEKKEFGKIKTHFRFSKQSDRYITLFLYIYFNCHKKQLKDLFEEMFEFNYTEEGMIYWKRFFSNLIPEILEKLNNE